MLFIAIAGWVVAALMAFTSYRKDIKNTELSDAVVKSNEIIAEKIPSITNQIAVIQHNTERQTRDTGTKKPLPSVPATIMQMDTIQLALNKQLQERYSAETKILRDSLGLYRTTLLKNTILLASERMARKNITVERMDPKQSEVKNASIGLYEFAKQKNPSMFSPNRSYLRITNNLDSGLINGMSYLDYELRNDQIYQLMFQVRSSWSPWTGRATVGVGTELKLNNVSFNAVLSYGNRENWLNPTFGLRYDFARIVFK